MMFTFTVNDEDATNDDFKICRFEQCFTPQFGFVAKPQWTHAMTVAVISQYVWQKWTWEQRIVLMIQSSNRLWQWLPGSNTDTNHLFVNTIYTAIN